MMTVEGVSKGKQNVSEVFVARQRYRPKRTSVSPPMEVKEALKQNALDKLVT